MKTAIIVSAIASVFFWALGIYMQENEFKQNRGDDYIGSTLVVLTALVSSAVFLALFLTALVRMVWRNL